jgi:ADP-dependent NAD(P)H-hydrate dehydratase / NAD(P)H-hydrate epimerase
MKALSAAEMREVDRLTTERHGIPSLQLMESAGKSVFDLLQSQIDSASLTHAVLLCGKGNNGGDGLVVARYLQEAGFQPSVYLFASPEALGGDAAENYLRLKKSGAAIRTVKDEPDWEAARPSLNSAKVLVDALFGTGLKGKVEGLAARVIQAVNAISRDATAVQPVLVLAVDTPSGLPSEGEPAQGPVVRAHWTITFTAPKIGQLIGKDAACTGKLNVCCIGSPAALVEELGKSNLRWIEPGEFRNLPLIRRPDSHKGNFGHVLVIAGSLGKTGAAVLAGRGALRAGAGLVTVAAPANLLPIIASKQPEYMTHPLLSTNQGAISGANLRSSQLQKLLEGKTLLAIGPGLGLDVQTQRFIRHVVQTSPLPIILDADGLNAFTKHGQAIAKRKSKHLAVTPHPGEMARLLGTSSSAVQNDRVGTALSVAKAWNCQVVLKGFHTVLASPQGHAFVNTTGNAGLAKGGSGDVLTGILAGLAAQFDANYWMEALALGIYLHGRAADEAIANRAASGLIAGDIVEILPHTVQGLLTELRSSV